MHTKSTMTAAFLAVLALSVNGQRTGGNNNNVDSVDSVGCCYGADSTCNGATEIKCARMAARGIGCEWRSGDDADCTFVPDPGCCYSASGNSRCEVDDETTCAKKGIRSDCEWRGGEDADCTPPTPEPGSCCATDDTKRNAAKCPDIDAEGSCNAKASRWGCEWRSGQNSCDGDSEEGLSVVCTGENFDCHGETFDCPNTGMCQITCDGNGACMGVLIICPDDFPCVVSCSNEDDEVAACESAAVKWSETPGQGVLACSGFDACSSIQAPVFEAQEQMAFEAMISPVGQPASFINDSLLLLAGVSVVLMTLAAAFYVYARKAKDVTASWEDEE